MTSSSFGSQPQIAIEDASTDVPARWRHAGFRHFRFSEFNPRESCEACNQPLYLHLWRVRSGDGTYLECEVAA